MECVMVLLGEKTDWDTVKKVLGNVGEFMTKLLEYNVEETTEKTWKKARDGWISKPEFDPVEVKKISLVSYFLNQNLKCFLHTKLSKSAFLTL
jgi:hypothetical protein